MQWGIGLAIDAFGAAGWTRVASFQGAFGIFGAVLSVAQLWFHLRQRRMLIICRNPPMMTPILIIAHAPLASALKTVAGHTYPDGAAAL